MAQMTRRPEPKPDLDYDLNYQFRAWESVPEYAAWWSEMEGIDKEVFHLEWVGITESRFHQLQRAAEQGLLTTAQRKRYDQLLKLVAEHRPIVEQLLAS